MTLLVPLGVLLADRLPAPGVLPANWMPVPGVPDESQLGLFALGVWPIIAAYVLVELVAMAVPRWNRLRHAGEAVRAKLELAARILMLVLAGLQAFGIAFALYADNMPPSALGGMQTNVLLVVASQVGAVVVLYVAALWITRQGLVNGLLLLMATFAVPELLSAITTALMAKSELGELDARGVALTVFAVALPVVAALLALGGAKSAPSRPDNEGGGLRPLQPWVPVPASSIYPYTAAGSLLMLPATLQQLGVRLPSPAPGLASMLWLIGLVVVLGAVFSFLFQRPSAVTALARRLGMAAPDSEATARAAVGRALLPTFLFLACLVLARGILSGAHAPDIGIATCLVVAIALDFAASVRAVRADPGRVVVWHERRPYAATAVCAGLRAHGIEAQPRGLLALGLLSFFAPYAPAEITVAAADAERAGELVEGWFVREQPEPEADVSPEAVAGDRSPAPKARVPRSVLLALAVVAGVAAWVIARRPEPLPANVAPATLQVDALDDSGHPLANIKSVPRDIEIETEDVPTGTAASGHLEFEIVSPSGDLGPSGRRYAVAHARRGESASQTRARLLHWLARVRLAPGERFAAQDLYTASADVTHFIYSGARSYVLEGRPIVTSADITDVEPTVSDDLGSCAVRVTLTQRGAKRFLDATRRLVHRRMAILVDGVVDSAPVVMSPIPGGHLVITLGDSAQDPCREARHIAASLRLGAHARSAR